MIESEPPWLVQRRKQFMRPDAHRYLRQDYGRFLPPGSLVQKANFDPEQPRDELGRWSDGGDAEGDDESGVSSAIDDVDAGVVELLSAASRKNGGHHYVPQAVVRSRVISDEAREVFDAATTGRLLHPSNNLWDSEHRLYNDAVGEALDGYLLDNRIRPNEMSREQAKEFLGRILDSKDTRIRSFNLRIFMREFSRMLLRRGGQE